MNRIFVALTLASACMAGAPSLAQQPEGYPADYSKIVDAAKKEGVVVIYGTNGIKETQPLLDGFKAAYPDIEVEYTELNSLVLYNRVISENAAGSTADLAITSASDLHVKLAQDGIALTYRSPEAEEIGPHNVYKDQVYNLENEPICNLYNNKEVKAEELPKTHAEFRKLIQEDKFRGKVNTYDIERSAVAYTAMFRDSKIDKDFWALPKALGAADARFFPSAFAMSEKVGTGETLLAYNIPCQVLAAVKDNPTIGNYFFTDYVLMTAQTALISKVAQHPNAAKVFLDFLLSKNGQAIYGKMPGIYPLRDDVEAVDTAGINKLDVKREPIALTDELTQALDPKIRTDFLAKWKSEIKAGAAGK